MIIFAVDPGSEKSGWVTFNTDTHEVSDFGTTENGKLEGFIDCGGYSDCDIFAYEMIGHYGKGMPAGKSVFETCIWIGHFEKAWNNKCTTYRILNNQIRVALCGTVRAKEKNIHLAAKETFEPYGGGKDPYKGIKSQPGPLFGMTGHEFSALAVALAWEIMHGKK